MSASSGGTATLAAVDWPPKKLSILTQFAICSFGVGINFGWGIFFVLATPVFRELGLSDALNAFATASGPVCGFFQPIIGVFSDRCQSRLGRRRPFILAGLIIGFVGMLLFANAINLGRLFQPGTSIGNPFAIAIAIIALWFFNLDMIQAAGMAYILDVCSTDEQRDSLTAYFTAASGLALILANFLGFVNFKAAMPFFQSNAQAIFYLGVIVIVVFTIPTLIILREIPLPELVASGVLKLESTMSVANTLKSLFWAFVRMNKPTLRIVLLYFASNGAQYPWQLYFTDYMGADVYKGDANAPSHTQAHANYNLGVRMGALAMGLMGVMTFLVSFAVAPAVKLIGYKAVYLIAHMWGAVSIILPIWPMMSTPIPAIELCTVGGLFNAITTAIPFTLIGLAVPEDQVGVNIGVLNVVQVLSQIIMGAVAGAIMGAVPKSWGLGSVVPGISGAGLLTILGIPLIFMLVIPPSHEERKKEKEDAQRSLNPADETTSLITSAN